MSRYSPDVDREDLREQPAAGQQSSGRGGGGGASAAAELIAIIDQAAADKPTMSQLLDRLQARGVQPIPSVNARGLNGMSYAFRGATLKGSDLGRAYTAHGLQQRKGIDYLPDRDGLAVRNAVERAHGFTRTDAVERVVETPARGTRARDRESGLSVEQRATLREIGMFRAIETRDLVRHRYGGRRDDFEADFRVLKAAGLVERAGVEHPKSGRIYSVVALTKAGERAARRLAGGGSGQRFYSGFVKPAEVRHDVGIYRMYQRERAAIEAGGGTIRRVVTDFEIKRRLMSELNRYTSRNLLRWRIPYPGESERISSGPAGVLVPIPTLPVAGNTFCPLSGRAIPVNAIPESNASAHTLQLDSRRLIVPRTGPRLQARAFVNIVNTDSVLLTDLPFLPVNFGSAPSFF